MVHEDGGPTRPRLAEVPARSWNQRQPRPPRSRSARHDPVLWLQRHVFSSTGPGGLGRARRRYGTARQRRTGTQRGSAGAPGTGARPGRSAVRVGGWRPKRRGNVSVGANKEERREAIDTMRRLGRVRLYGPGTPATGCRQIMTVHLHSARAGTFGACRVLLSLL